MRSQGPAKGRQAAMKSRLLCGSALASFAIISLATGSSAFGQDTGSPNSPGNTISPDGRTATSLSVQGKVTDITTGTLAGGNAYNSFSTFGAAEGNTVNLHVPTGAGYLVNIVRSAPVDIQGTVNSYQNGSIGGNIVFADPYGLVVGKKGTINTGGLTIVTPTSATLDNVLNKAGQIDQALAARMIEGNVPISPDGSVVIAGKINAESYVKITAHDITVAGSEKEAKKSARQKAQFHATVNSSGMAEGGAIVVRNGSIKLVAAGDVNVGGKVHAKGPSGAVSIRAQGSVNVEKTARIKAGSKSNQVAVSTQTAPVISIEAGKTARIDGRLAVQAAQSATAGQIAVRAGNTSIGSTAAFVAKGRGTADGGTISIKSDIDTTVASGARFTASALGTGNGGFVEISAVCTDTIAAGVKYDLGSKSGKSGTILFDPTDLVIGGTSGSASIYSNGVNVVLDASNSITIAGVIDTRAYSGNHVTGLLSAAGVVSTGSSGSVTLTAPSITISGGGAIYADVNNSASTAYTAGDVNLTAAATDLQAWAPSSATTGITIAGTITGANITASATSTSSVSLLASTANIASTVGRTVFGLLTGINGGYLGSSATANVSVLSGASIRGSGAVTLSASGSETASDIHIVPATGLFQQLIGAAIVVGETNASVSTNIASGATIYSGGKLTVSAINSATLSVNAQVYSTNTAADSAFAYSTGTIRTTASIDSGANISQAGSVAIAAQNTNNFSTAASANAMGNGNAGVAVAVSNINTYATANLGANVTSAGNIDVYSGSNTTANVVRASTTVGNDFAGDTFSSIVSESSFLTDVFGPGGYFQAGKAGQAAANGGMAETAKGGITLGLNLGSQSSEASLTAQNVTATGSVGVVSLLTDTGIRSDASSQINSSSDPSPFNPAATTAVSMAVAVAQITHNSNAFIASGSHVSAGQIVVDAQTEVPILNSWMQWSDFSSVISHLNANAGVVNDILTSYANATATATDGGISGAVNYFNVTNNTTAWVGSNAVLVQTGTAAPASTYSISGDGFDTSFQTVDIAGNIEIKALTETQSINVGGNFSWLGIAGTNGGSSDAKAVGGSANVNIFNSNTIAGIAAGASVTSAGILDVSAKTADTVFAVSPTSGKGSGLGLNGIASVLMIDNNTSASISSLATISAPTVSISAQQQLSSFDIAGTVGSSTSSGVGLSVALVDLETATTAFIGDNSQELAKSGAASDDAGTGYVPPGTVTADRLAVTALTTGRLQTLSVAAQYANNAVPPAASEALQLTAPDDANYLTQLSYYMANKMAVVAAKIDDAVNNLTSDNMNMVNGTGSMAGAGSSSISLTSLATSASVADAHISAFTSGAYNSVSVQALNNTILTTASGAAAVAIGAPGTSRTAAIAGTLALDNSADMTSATIVRSQVTATNIAVQALAGGENTVIGLAVALTSGSGSSATNASISGSVLVNHNGVQALVDRSSLGGASTLANGAISIAADQNTRIGIGGGALSAGLTGGGTGIGIALTYVEIGDPSSGDAVSAILSNSTVVNTARLSVMALDQSRIVAGAAVATGGAGTYGFAGSVIVNRIAPTITAKILNGSVTTSGDATVSSSGGSDSNLDALISNAQIAATGGLASSGGGTGSGNANIDFSASAVSPASASGAAIIAVAGQVAYGKSNVGLSLVVNQIAQINQATVDGVTLISGGTVTVTSTNDAEILGVAVGANFAAGSVAGLGSVVYNSIADGVVAQIGGSSPTSVTAKSVSVTAEDGAHIRGATGALAANLNSSAVGLSVTVNQIANYVAATISTASVTVNLPTTASAMGGSLLVSGQSDATITTASVTGSFSGGASATTPSSGGGSSSSPLSMLFTKFVPASLARLQAASTPPQQQSAPSTPGTSSLTGAGSISLSTEATSVYASIVNSATVAAQNNVILLANNSDAITVYAGSLALSAGTGTTASASVLVNEISGTTSAYVSGSTVDAFGRSTGYGVDNGQLLTAVDPSSIVSPNALPALQNGSVTVNGIAVVATSLQTVKTVSAVAAGSASGTALAANVITNTMRGATSAYAVNALLDTNLTSTSPDIRIAASSAAFANNLDVGMAGSGGNAAGTVTLVINLMSGTTNAYLQDSTTGSAAHPAGAVAILANAWLGTSGISAGVAASDSVGVAGSALANTFSAKTSATAKGGTLNAGTLAVKANTTDGYYGIVGSYAIGGTAGVGAGVIVATMNNETNAYLGATDDAIAVTLSGAAGTANALAVNASTTTKTKSYDFGFALGGTGGVAAMATVNLLTNKTLAKIENANVTILAASPAGQSGIDVSGNETVNLNATTGGVAAGGSAAGGAAVNVAILKSSNQALINQSSVTTPGSVGVSATSARDITAKTVTGALAGSVALAGTAGVVLVGGAASAAQMSDIGASVGSADTATRSGGSMSAALGAGSDGITAAINGGTVTANAVTIAATGNVAVENAAGAVAASGSAGLGAAVGYTTISQAITAQASGGTIATQSLSITASAGDDGGRAAHTAAIAGGGGGYAGLGAAVAISEISNTINALVNSTVSGGTATVNGVTGTVLANTVTVSAGDTSTSASDVTGVAVSIYAAVGASVAKADRSSIVNAKTQSSANLVAQTVSVQASEGGATYAFGLGGAGGAGLAGTGVDVTATDTAQVNSSVLAGSRIVATSGLTVSATASPDAKAFAFGVSAGSSAAGISIADAEANATVTAYVEGGADLTQTSGLTIKALVNITGTSATAFPSIAANLLTSTSDFQAGGTTAAAWSIAGSGALSFAFSDTKANAKSNTTVTAETRDGVRLPSGAVSISASNTTNQYAKGTGVALSGGLAVGLVDAEASSTSTTTARVGQNTLSTAQARDANGNITTPGTGDVSISATGSDTNNADSTAGAGGVYAGNGSVAGTTDTSTVTASVGDNSRISATSISVSADHSDIFGQMANSLNAGIVGASAALSRHDGTSTVGVDIGTMVALNASAGGLTKVCIAYGCQAAVNITATNTFTDTKSGTRAGAGGGINGAGATSTININRSGGGTTISIGNGDDITSGTDATLAPGSISMVATSVINIADEDDLTTGGVIQGAGVNSTVNAVLTNEIDIGTGVALATRGSINLATYTTGAVTATGNASTWGVAAVGSANASIDLTENERIKVLSSAANPTTLAAFYNVNVTAGKDLMQAQSNALSGNAIAQGYVRGLIAVPTAEATTSIATNASVDLGAGSRVYAGQNVSVAANRGGAAVQADGTGHGYELAFIPVTVGHDSAVAPTTSTVNLGGTIVAGQYHTLELTINADGTVTENASGAPVNYTYSATNASSCSASITASCLLTAAQYQTLLNHGNISSGNIAAVRFGALFASGGNADIMADTLTGGGSIYAYGSPSITVNNANPIAVVLVGGAYIPNVPAGLITFSGNATEAAANAAGIARHADGTSTAGSITIALTNTSGDRGAGAPLIVDAPITNLGGVVSITNSNGSLIYQTVYAADSAGNFVLDAQGNKKAVSIGGTQGNQVLVSVPYGALIVDANSADGSFIAGASPVTEWSGSAIYPGGIHGTNANNAIMYVASSIYVNQLQGVDNIQNNGGGDINTSLYGTALDGPVNGNNAANGHSELILFGACSYNGLLACPSGATISVYHTTQTAYVQQALSYTITNPDLQSVSGSAQSQQIYGNLIEVHAATIDINGAIYAGPPTVYNITLNAAIGSFVGQLNQYRQSLAGGDISTAYAISQQLTNQYGVMAAFNLLNTAYTGGSLDVSSYLGFSANSARDVKATYDFSTGRISLDKIEAHSTGASIVLDGAIISSNTLGNIHINSGFGQVVINNQTGFDLSVDGINTGSAANASAATSTVMIVDRLKDQVNGTSANDTKTFVYNPGAGVKTYISSNGANPIDGNGNVVGGAWLESSSSGTTATYSPVTGASYQYVQEAQLKRFFTTTIKEGATVFASASDWVFVSGTPGNPYYYVSPDAVPSTASGWVSSSGISLTPVGKVIVDPSAPLYRETIFGNIISHGYQASDNNGNPAECWQGYPCAAPYNVAQWYPDWAFVRVTSVERADNNVGITFSGSATGAVTINSNASVIVSGDIKNPTGLTSITTSPNTSSIQQVQDTSISGASVNLTSGGFIGTSANPVNVTITTGLGTTTGSFSGAAGNGGVIANLNSGANGLYVSAANGSVQLTAAGNLVAASGSYVSGTNVTLKSTNGSIGATNQLLTVQTARSGVLNVAAYGDIGLYIPAGDLLIGQIASSAGNVAVTVANGNIYDSLSQTSASALSQDQIAAIATALHLIGTSDADAGAAAIKSFENTVNANLATYLQFIANGTVASGTIGALDSVTLSLYAPFANSAAVAAARTAQSGATHFVTPTNAQILATANDLAAANGVFTLALTNANRAQYQALAAAALGVSAAQVASVTDEQIQAWANARYQAYATTFADAYGTAWQTAVPSATTPFTVTAGSALATKLTMSSNWTAAQMVQAVDVSAMQPSSTTVGSSATPDIVGHDVKLVTQSGAIGTYNPNGMQISLAQLIDGTLSSQQQAALATATTPGSVSLIGTDASGHALAAGTSLTTLGAGSTVTGLNIAQTAPVFVSASGAFTISSASSVYLQATAGSSININQLTAQGDVDLKAPGNIAASLVAGQPSSSTQIITPGNLVLVAGSGNIGSSAVPLTLQIGGALINASAGGSVNIDFASGDASLQRVFAGGTATISTHQGYSIYSGLSGINISAGNIVLNSGKNIGSVNTALAVSTTGHLSGSASGIANISAPTVNSAQPNSLTVSTLTASGSIWLSAGQALTVTDTISSTGGNIQTASASLLMNAGTLLKAFGTVTANTLADATLAAIESLLNPATTTDAISISAGGTLYSAASGLSLTTGANGTATLAATLGIGSATSALTLDTASLFSASATGNNAGIYITSSGALQVGTLQAAGALKLTADTLSIGSATSGGDATYLASGNLGFTLLKSTGGKISATSTTSSVSGTTVAAYGNAGISAFGDSIGTGITSTTGKIVVASAGGQIDWSALSAATTIDLTASGSTLTVGSATSGGSQTLHSKGNLTYTTLKTTGITGDAGDIALTSDTGAIGVTGTNTLEANGGFGLTAATTISASSIKADHGAGLIQAAGAVNASVLTAATTLSVTSTGSTLTVGSATSGGTQTLHSKGDLSYASLKTTGISGDTGDIALTSDTGAIAATGTDALEANGGFNVAAGTTISASSLKADSGAGIVRAAGAINVSGITTATTLGITSTGGTLTVSSATSGSNATYLAAGDIGFTLLKSTGGNISARSSAGAVSGTTVAASGDTILSAFTESVGSDITATHGKIGISATNGRIDWSNLSAATTIVATATGSTLTVGSATSGGSQTLHSRDNLTYTNLKTTGIAGDPGDIAPISDTAAIGVSGTDTLEANGGFNLAAAGTVSASSLKANHGTGVVQAAGAINVARVATVGALRMASTGSALTVASGNSTGDGNYKAYGNIGFGDIISSTGSIVATSQTGGINGTELSAPGDVTLDAATTIGIAKIDPANVTIGAASSVSIGQLIASGTVNLASGSIDVTTLSQDPSASGSFNVNLRGYRGGMGQSASLRIVTQNLLNIGSLNENTASISTTSGNVVIGSGRIMQSLLLTTAQQSIYMTAFFATPQNGYGVQSYLPTGSFYLQQYGLETTTNSLVVQFASGAKVRQDMNGRMILGFSLAGNVGQVIGSVGSANEDGNDTSAPTWNPDPGVYSTLGDGQMNSSGYVPAVNWTAKQPMAITFSSGTPTLQ